MMAVEDPADLRTLAVKANALMALSPPLSHDGVLAANTTAADE
jgi:hypothetical protein